MQKVRKNNKQEKLIALIFLFTQKRQILKRKKAPTFERFTDSRYYLNFQKLKLLMVNFEG
jgi:hypothetical protein